MASDTSMIRARVSRGHWLLIPAVLFTASRVIYGLILHTASSGQESTYPYLGGTLQAGYHVYRPTDAAPGYWGVVANWDGQWYQHIAESGYPSVAEAPDARSQHRWAFPPLYPLLVAGVMRSFSLPFHISASIVTLAFGLLASVLVYALINQVAGKATAILGTWFVVNAPAAPLLQVAYSESFALALIAATLLSIRHRKYGIVIPLILLLGSVRLITVPIALVLLLHLIERRRSGPPMLVRETLAIGGGIFTALVSVFVWPGVSGWLGAGIENRAVRQTRAGVGGYFVEFWSLTPLLTLALVAGVWILYRYVGEVRVKRLGLEMQVWAFSYPVFLLIVTTPTTGIIRYMLLAFPLWASLTPMRLDRRRSWLAVGAVTVVLVVLNLLWVENLFIVRLTGRDLVPVP